MEETEGMMECLNITTLIIKREMGTELWTRDYIGGLGHTREVEGVDMLSPSVIEGIDVILFEGLTEVPNNNAALWNFPTIRAVLGFGRVGNRRRRRFNKEGWEFTTRSVSHGEVGGVTTARFLAWVASRSEFGDGNKFLEIHTINTISGYATIVNPVTKGGRKRRIREGEIAEELVRTKRRCLLNWNTRFNEVECQTVFHKGLVIRRLEPKELAVALDLPNSRVKSFKGDLRDLTEQVEVPGKIVQSIARAVISNLGTSKRSRPKDQERELIKRQKLGPIVGMTRSPDVDLPLCDGANPSDAEAAPSPTTAETGTTVTTAAAKSDDAEVPYWLWDQEVLARYPPITKGYRKRVLQSLNLLRQAALRYWRWNVKRDFNEWIATATGTASYSRHLMIERGEEIFDKVDHASWWNWDKGSTLFFWRWPSEYLNDVLLGGPVRFDKIPIPWFERAKEPMPKHDLPKMKKKMSKVLMKGYVKLVDRKQLTSLLNMFFVPKGLDDLRGVYDATKSGLNSALWTPWFWLPTAETILRELMPGYWSTDNDYGEQFLNFPLHPLLLQFAGIDLTKILPELATKPGDDVFAMWLRNLMGLQCSPYISVMGASRAKRIILGNRHDRSNPFHWDTVKLNLPGDEDYDCSKPRVMRLRFDGLLATAIAKFVDDVRSSAPTRSLAWEASTRTGKTLSWLGLQDAPRKRREASQEPGAWAGTMVSTSGDRVRKFVSQDRWCKTKDRLDWFAYMMHFDDVDQPSGADWGAVRKATPKGHLEFKTAERYCGFIRYVAQTYHFMVPYLKGIYNTLNIWRPHRDQDGWKGLYDHKTDTVESLDQHERANAPTYVRFARRLRGDIMALRRLCVNSYPPKLAVRPQTNLIVYLSGDASGSGFGMMMFIPGHESVMFSHGVWTDDTSEKSSNFRESVNLVMKLRDYLRRGIIPYGAQVFICTDNRVAERTYYKGSGGTRQLHELVIELRELEMEGDLHIITVWCAGTRLIRSGTDGLSRGDFSNGVLAGRDSFLDFVPLNKSAFERSPSLERWIEAHTNGMLLQWRSLSPEQWFDEAYAEREGAFVWCPPPAAAQIALEQMCEAKHVRPDSSHIFIVPDLMAFEWEKRLRKISDLVVELEPKSPLWDADQHEGLTIAFICPFLSDRPHAVGRTDWVSARAKAMSSVWEEDPGAAGACLHNFPVLGVQDIDDSLIDDNFMVDEDKDRFKVARDGDYLMTPFQCDVCHFENVQRRPPSGSQVDLLALQLIRRANLDSMWSRERSTVYGNQREGVRTVIKSRLAGVDDPYPPRGPTNDRDDWGMATAMVMLLRSLDEGKNAPTIQFDTARGVRSHMSNYWHASAQGVGDVLVGSDGTVTDVSNAPTNSYWFRRFIRGCHRRMGDIWKPNRPMLIAELKACLKLLEEDWFVFSNLKPPDRAGMRRAGLTATMIIAGFFAALRGEEICRIDVGSMRKHWHESQHLDGASHVPLMMAGRFKGDHTEKLFCQPLANTTKTGVTVKIWVERTLQILDAYGIQSGPMFRVMVSKKFKKASVSDLDVDLHWIIKRVQMRHPDMIPMTGPSAVDIENDYSCMRSLRRGATSHACNMGIPKSVVEANNRWRKHLRSRGMRPQMSMMERYSDAKASVPSLIRFSGGM